MNSKIKNQNKISAGFTLIEMSIVIIIVGLMIGGIVAGRGLMKSAQISGVIAELSYYMKAKDDFRDKYKYLPGDVPFTDAQNFFSGAANLLASASAFGNAGDGKWSNDHFESDAAFIELSYADFIDQKIDFNPDDNGERTPGIHRPISKTLGRGGYTFRETDSVIVNVDHNFYHVLRLGIPNPGGDQDLRTGILTVDMHRAIDAKIDQPDTPLSGVYFVYNQCLDANNLYLPDTSDAICIGGYAEKDVTQP